MAADPITAEFNKALSEQGSGTEDILLSYVTQFHGCGVDRHARMCIFA